MPNPNTMMMITNNQEIHNLQVDKDHQLIQASQCSHIDMTPAEPFARQATINIGIIGHTAHGRSELIQAISEVNKDEKEKEKNSFNRFPGFTNVKIFKCPKCLQPDCYKAYSSTQDDHPLCPNPYCGEPLKLVRHVSFVEYPSIEILMSTMLAGADIIDACLLLVASNTACPQQQTLDHLAAIEMMKLGEKTIILQNNIDLLEGDEKLAMKNLQEIKTFVKGTTAENAPIIPISAQFRYNMDALCKYICEYIPVPVRDLSSTPEMPIARSFDVNRPETNFDELRGGIVGGRILKGTLKIGDKVEIRPGYVVKDNDNRISHCIPIMSKVVSLSTDNDNLEYAVSGGAIGVELAIDPSLAESSKLAGNVLGLADQLPEVYKEIEVSYYLLHKLLGVKSEASNTRVKKITPGELLRVNIGSSSVSGSVKSVDGQRVKIALISKPVCAKIGEKVTISRRIEQTWRLIGWGVFEDGEALPIVKP